MKIRTEANHKESARRMLGKSEGIMNRMFKRKMSITMQMNMKQGKVKTQKKRKI